MFQQLVDWVSGAWWSYPLIFSVAMLDAFLPIVPSETVAIAGGVLAGSGDLSLPLVIPCAVGGAIVIAPACVRARPLPFEWRRSGAPATGSASGPDTRP